MLENRSFDHMCGWLKKINPAIEGLTGKETNPFDTADPTKGHCTVGDTSPDIAAFDPDHSLTATSEKIFGKVGVGANPAPMNGFYQFEDKLGHKPPADVMNMFLPVHVPIISSLALDFALFDQWFASVPGPTHPNRLFSLTATSRGTIDNTDISTGFPQRSIFDQLDDADVNWKYYYTDQMWAYVLLASLRTNTSLPRIKKWDDFLADAKAGKLPPFSYIEPKFASSATGAAQDQHPDHPITAGEATMKEVYETLRASPHWNDTLLIITYDEHGGFYDHVATPQDGIPKPDSFNAPTNEAKFNFERLGLRVPTILVSPWINKGTLISKPVGPTNTSRFEHSSLPATLGKIFGFKSFLTKRDEWAATFEQYLTQRTTPRTDCPTTLPDLPALSNEQIMEQANLPLNDLQCSYLKIFPGSNKDCSITQQQCYDYTLQLGTEELARVAKQFQ
jgi:phospholipase C